MLRETAWNCYVSLAVLVTTLRGSGSPALRSESRCDSMSILVRSDGETSTALSGNRGKQMAELAAVLASPTFAHAANISKVLQYVCGKVFEDQADSIKEYSIAVDALGRSPDFDPNANSIVRVEAWRLRKRLKEYYAGEGAPHDLYIVLPESGYVPEFRIRYRRAKRRAGEVEAPKPAGATDARSETSPPFESRSAAHLSDAEAQAQSVVCANPGVAEGSPDRIGRQVRPRKWLFAATGALSLLVAVILVSIGIPSTFRRGALSRINRADAPGSWPTHPPPAEETADTRILVGLSGSNYLDSTGQTWASDRYFTGGNVFSRQSRRIFRTLDQAIYQTPREGDFRYDIPLKPGSYELHLYFAEPTYEQPTPESGGEGERRFNVSLNGRSLLAGFDVASDAGGLNVADEKVFKNVLPANDGFMHLAFSGVRSSASLNGIEILRGSPWGLRPIRIVCSLHPVYDRAGQLWGADRFFLGGRLAARWAAIQGRDPELYGSNRWGHFSYAIPVAEGTYRVTLRVAETNFGPSSAVKGGDGSRLFAVYCNGVALLRNFDVFKEAGGDNRALERVFSGLRPDAQGKLLLSFVPLKDYACVYAIEVTDEAR